MKTNKGFAPIAIVLVILTVLSVGGIAYYTGKSSKIPSQDAQVNNYQPKTDTNISVTNTTKTQVQLEPKEDLLEYVNNEAGFSFKYPKKFGEVNLRPTDPDTGYGYQGTVGIPGKYYFSFGFNSRNASNGDTGPTDPKAQQESNCKLDDYICELIPIADGSMVTLMKRIDHPEWNFERYVFFLPLDKTSKYSFTSFVSTDRSIIVDIASQVNVFSPK